MRANEEYLAYRSRGVMSNGRRLGPSTVPKPWVAPDTPTGKVNVTDPDARNVKMPRGYLQGYNAQAVCNEQQIVIAAEITGDSPDFGHLQPMITATQRELHAAGDQRPARGRRRRHRLLAPHPDGRTCHARYHRPDPARRRQAQRHPPGLGRRALRLHAPRSRDRHRRPRSTPSASN
jgi:hypothetical protein